MKVCECDVVGGGDGGDGGGGWRQWMKLCVIPWGPFYIND